MIHSNWRDIAIRTTLVSVFDSPETLVHIDPKVTRNSHAGHMPIHDRGCMSEITFGFEPHTKAIWIQLTKNSDLLLCTRQKHVVSWLHHWPVTIRAICLCRSQVAAMWVGTLRQRVSRIRNVLSVGSASFSPRSPDTKLISPTASLSPISKRDVKKLNASKSSPVCLLLQL